MEPFAVEDKEAPTSVENQANRKICPPWRLLIVSGVMALLSLIAGIVLVVASNEVTVPRTRFRAGMCYFLLNNLSSNSPTKDVKVQDKNGEEMHYITCNYKRVGSSVQAPSSQFKGAVLDARVTFKVRKPASCDLLEQHHTEAVSVSGKQVLPYEKKPEDEVPSASQDVPEESDTGSIHSRHKFPCLVKTKTWNDKNGIRDNAEMDIVANSDILLWDADRSHPNDVSSSGVTAQTIYTWSAISAFVITIISLGFASFSIYVLYLRDLHQGGSDDEQQLDLRTQQFF